MYIYYCLCLPIFILEAFQNVEKTIHMESELDQQYVNQLVAKTFDLYMGVDQDGDLCGYNNLNGKRFLK